MGNVFKLIGNFFKAPSGNNVFKLIADFLKDPSGNMDSFWESEALIWVDWGEDDEDILAYCNDRLPEGDRGQQ